MIALRPRDQHETQDHYLMRTRPRPTPITVRPRPKNGVETLASLQLDALICQQYVNWSDSEVSHSLCPQCHLLSTAVGSCWTCSGAAGKIFFPNSDEHFPAPLRCFCNSGTWLTYPTLILNVLGMLISNFSNIRIVCEDLVKIWISDFVWVARRVLALLV